MPRQSNSLEWFKKSEVDYFSSFVKLWLSFNSLYKNLFQNDNLGKDDRKYIEELKAKDNLVKRKFKELFEEDSDDGKEFRLYLAEFIKTFDGGIFGGKNILRNEVIRPQMNGNALNEINFKIFIHPRSPQLKRKHKGYIKIGKYCIKDEPEEIWPYFMEVLYMVRNQLIHGELEPNDENHKIIKACHIILNLLLKDMV